MPDRSWLLARSWIPLFATAAILLVPAGVTPQSTYTLRWVAAGLVLLAAIGRKRWTVALAAAALAGAGALFITVDSTVRVLSGGMAARSFYVAGGLIVLALSLWQLRGKRHLDPVFLVAVQLAVGLVAYWFYDEFSGLALDYRTYAQDSLSRAAGIELSLLALAFAAAGLGVSRTWRPAAERLGWLGLKRRHIALAVMVAGFLLLSNIPLNLLMSRLMPDSQLAIARIYLRVFNGVPWWSFPIFAVMAGLCEETMFRGALQPRFGIVATAALFALIHIQYGPTLVLVWVFAHGIAYGLIRRHINTTTAVLAHAIYDFAAFLPGIGILAFGGVAVFMAASGAVSTLALSDERKRRRLRSYLSPPWKSPPSSTD